MQKRALFLVGLAAMVPGAPGSAPASRGALDPERVRPFLLEYADYAFGVYSQSAELAGQLAKRIDELATSPDETTLAAARKAWLAAREVYGTTEVLRFYGGPIDDRDDGPETFINAWPVDESYLDRVPGDPDGGILQDVARFPILDAAVLRAANERGGEANI